MAVSGNQGRADVRKTKKELIGDLQSLRRRVSELERSIAGGRRRGTGAQGGRTTDHSRHHARRHRDVRQKQ